MELFSQVLEAVRASYGRIGAPGRVLAALSGGADSTALLRALCALREEAGFTLRAVHVNHGLRADAALDEAFARDLCAGCCVPFTAVRVQVSPRGSLEDAARRARYAAFDEALQDTASDVVALAHHADDQAETVLLHLLRGSGAAGLGGMAERSGQVWRPLLDVRGEALREALRELSQPWREDESNADTAFLRNRVRARVMPVLSDVNARAVDNIRRCARVLRDESALLDSLAFTLLEGAARLSPPCRFVLADALAGADVALQRRALRRFAASAGLTLDFAQTERLRALLGCGAGESCNLPCGYTALRTRQRLHLLPPAGAPAPVRRDWALCEEPFAGNWGDGRLRQAFPLDALRRAQLRLGRPGDFIRPFGMEGRQSLSDYLMARGIDRPFRAHWPLLCAGDEVLWVIGVGASQRARVVKGHADAALCTFCGILPDAVDEGITNG